MKTPKSPIGISLVLALFAIGLPVSAALADNKKTADTEKTAPDSAAAWASYLKMMGGYYHIDKHGPVHVSCHLTVPWLEEMLGKVNAARGSTGWARALTGFAVNYNSGSEPSFATPQLNLAISADRKADATLREAVGLVITNVKESVTTMVENLGTPERAKFSGLAVSTGADGITNASYVDDKGDRIQEFHMGNLEIDKGVTKTGEAFEAKVEFTPLPRGGLAASTVKVKVTKAPGTVAIFSEGGKTMNDAPVEVTATFTTEYQDLGKFFFPSKIIHTMDIANNREHPDPPIEVDLTDCTGGK